VGSDRSRTKTFQQSIRQIAPCKRHSIETLERVFELHFHAKFNWDFTWVDVSVFAAGETVRQNPWIPKPRGQGFAWQMGQITQGGYSQPPKGVNHLLTTHRLPQCPQVEPGEKRDGVPDHIGLTYLGGCRCPAGGKWAIGDTNKELATTTGTGQGVEFFDHSGRQWLLAIVETDRPCHRHEQKTW
jgi:hypothetical protein